MNIPLISHTPYTPYIPHSLHPLHSLLPPLPTPLLPPQLICDAGHQSEITSVSTACHQLEVFTSVLRSSATSFLSGQHRNPTRPTPSGSIFSSTGDHGANSSTPHNPTRFESLAKFIEDFTVRWSSKPFNL